MISVRGIGKRYRLSNLGPGGRRTLRDEIADRFAQALGRGRAESVRRTSSEFWALRDVSFEVSSGEVVGIIGRNGAGKSTLLKVLSRIVRPTAGEALIQGRMGSLLEVGTGFHPELTGRENIFMNAAILGMSKRDVLAKFDEIVSFAEVEAFLDTPVKRYSSGMYVRLAFAVAAHLEPEVLVIDEVLAVGDLAFQRKCLGRMNDVAKEGRTILFVSHNMGAVSSLCRRSILIEKGQVAFDGPTSEAVMRYASGGAAAEAVRELSAIDAPVQATRLEMRIKGALKSDVEIGQDCELCVEYEVRRPVREACLAVMLSRSGSQILYSYDSDLDESLREKREPGTYRCVVRLPTSLLKEGEYEAAVLIGVGKDNMTDPRASLRFSITNYKEDHTYKSYRADRPGVLYAPLAWRTTRLLDRPLDL